MIRQPWFAANSRSSPSEKPRRTRNSAGWVTTYSELIDSLPPIFAARAGKSLCICCCLAISRAVRVGNLLLRRQRWRPLGFTIQSSPKCVSSFAAGGRATRIRFLHIGLACCRCLCVSRISIKFMPGHKRHDISVSSLARRFSLANFCRCSRRRSNYAVTLLIRSSCRRCSIKF